MSCFPVKGILRFILIFFTQSFFLGGCLTTLIKGQEEISRCPALTDSDYQKWLSQKKTLIFFASWCGECKEKIAASLPDHDLLIGILDSHANIERAYLSTGTVTPCYFDEGGRLRQKFDIKGLPFRIKLDGSSR